MEDDRRPKTVINYELAQKRRRERPILAWISRIMATIRERERYYLNNLLQELLSDEDDHVSLFGDEYTSNEYIAESESFETSTDVFGPSASKRKKKDLKTKTRQRQRTDQSNISTKLAIELLTGTSLVNAFMAYQEITKQKLTITKFREEIVWDLLKIQDSDLPKAEADDHRLENLGRADRRMY
ncbi:hypothetical protein ILUMI_11036 [Ignelater luminosus]|uniref:Uncharacterized protein n=1 Tax=Ignelater luminosus TaxID=2038154 RepID=A0A8K0GEB8_IGNLU|nr:hypothetical protein ILUMI_11036 [Ignelater luminosus]